MDSPQTFYKPFLLYCMLYFDYLINLTMNDQFENILIVKMVYFVVIEEMQYDYFYS